MKIAMWGNNSGSFLWRLQDPAKYLRKKGFDVIFPQDGITREALEWADVFVVQGCTDKEGIAMMYEFQQEKGKKIVVECDDLLEFNGDNPHAKEWQVWDAVGTIKKTMEIADMITCTQDYLAKKLMDHNKNVVVLPNCMDLERWHLPIQKNNSGTIRIGWAGSITHLEDMKMVVKPLKQICAEFPKVQLVFCGDPRVGNLFDGCPVENMGGIPLDVWPMRLHTLKLDIGIAPLRDTEFNRCKSRIKFYEYGICKTPGVFSPTVYKERAFDGNLGMIAEDEDQWYKILKNYILFPQLREDIGKAAYSHVIEWCDLKKNINLWVKAYNSLF